MADPITPDEADAYNSLRERSAETLYRSGKRKRVTPGEPAGRNLIVAYLAKRIAQKATDEALALFGETGLVRIAETLVTEYESERGDGLTPTDDTVNASSANAKAKKVLQSFEQEDLKAIAARHFTSAGETDILDDYLENEDLFRSNETNTSFEDSSVSASGENIDRFESKNDVLVSADWVASHLDEFQSTNPSYRLVEVDVNTELYEEAHAPGAIGFDWKTDLQDQTERDILRKEDFEALMGSEGISEDSLVVLYGDNANWFAAYAYWQFKYYGHDDVRLMDGGRDYWIENDYPLTDVKPDFPEVEYNASGPHESIRAYREDVEYAIDRGAPLVDVRSPEEFRGEVLAPPGLQETAQRGGHIPGAKNISWSKVTNDDGTFRDPDELRDLYAEHGIDGEETSIAYCRIGERSSIAWFALHELLDYDAANYDGSWTEWGNLINSPIEKSEE